MDSEKEQKQADVFSALANSRTQSSPPDANYLRVYLSTGPETKPHSLQNAFSRVFYNAGLPLGNSEITGYGVDEKGQTYIDITHALITEDIKAVQADPQRLAKMLAAGITEIATSDGWSCDLTTIQFDVKKPDGSTYSFGFGSQ